MLATDVELTTVALSASATKTAVEPAAEIDGAVADAEKFLCEACGTAVVAPGGWIALEDRTTLRRARARYCYSIQRAGATEREMRTMSSKNNLNKT